MILKYKNVLIMFSDNKIGIAIVIYFYSYYNELHITNETFSGIS